MDELLKKLADINALIEPGEIVRLIEELGMLIDDLDLELVELQQQDTARWLNIKNSNLGLTNREVEMLLAAEPTHQDFKHKLVLIKRLRRYYRLLHTKLNLITKPRGR